MKYNKKIPDFFTICFIGGLASLMIIATFPRISRNFILIPLFLLMTPTIAALIKGAPYVPTPMKAGRKMLKLAGVKKGDNVLDIGCGDGRLIYLAANEIGANSTGYELSPIIYVLGKIRQFIWKSRAKIKFGDFRKHDLSKTDHIVCYMLPETLARFIPKFEKEMKKGAKITSYAFNIGSWNPIHVEQSNSKERISKIWIYEIGKQYQNKEINDN